MHQMNQFPTLRLAVASVIGLAASSAFAHPGHGHDGGSHELTHYFTEPQHLAPLGMAVVAGVAASMAVAWYRRKA